MYNPRHDNFCLAVYIPEDLGTDMDLLCVLYLRYLVIILACTTGTYYLKTKCYISFKCTYPKTVNSVFHVLSTYSNAIYGKTAHVSLDHISFAPSRVTLRQIKKRPLDNSQ